MTHRGPFQPLLFCDSVTLEIPQPGNGQKLEEHSGRYHTSLLSSQSSLGDHGWEIQYWARDHCSETVRPFLSITRV